MMVSAYTNLFFGFYIAMWESVLCFSCSDVGVDHFGI